jgi:hypothetical protein
MMVTCTDLIVADHSRSAQGRVHFINAIVRCPACVTTLAVFPKEPVRAPPVPAATFSIGSSRHMQSLHCIEHWLSSTLHAYSA